MTAHHDRLVDAYGAGLALGQSDPAQFCADVPAGCTLGADIHPTDAGYATLASEFWDASGYGRLPQH